MLTWEQPVGFRQPSPYLNSAVNKPKRVHCVQLTRHNWRQDPIGPRLSDAFQIAVVSNWCTTKQTINRCRKTTQGV